MNFLILNVVVWGIAVHALKVAFSGRLSLHLLATTPQTTVQLAADLFQREESLSEASEEVYRFLTKLAQVRLLSLIVVLIEYATCAYFLNVDPQDPVAWFIITKNLLLVAMIIRTRNDSADLDPIQSLLNTPRWMTRWERIMHFLTGLCLILQLARINLAL